MRLSGPVDLESLALFVEFVRNVTTKKADDNPIFVALVLGAE